MTLTRRIFILVLSTFILFASSIITGEYFVTRGDDEATRQTVQIIAPDNGTEVNGTVHIDAKVLYCNCSGNTSVYIDKDFLSIGTRYDLIGQDEYFRHEWDTTTVENGLHEILVFDKHSIAYDIIYLFVNNAGSPGLIRNTRITSPGNNTKIQGLVTVHAEVLTCNCSGLSSLYIDGIFISNGTYETTINHDGRWWELFTHSWDSKTVDNGLHTIRVYGKHEEYFDEINIMVENEDEEQNTVIISPQNNSEVRGNVRVGVRVLTCECNARTSLYMDGRFVSNGSLAGSVGQYEYFGHEWASTTVENGKHQIRAYGKHRDYYDEVTVYVNNTDDGSGDGEVRILSPEMNSEVSGVVTVRAEVLKINVSGNTSLYIDDVFVSNGTFDLATGQYEYYSHLWDSTTVENGLHRARVVLIDGGEFDQITLLVNNTKIEPLPEIRITTPANNTLVEGIVTVKAEVLAGNGTGNTSLYIDDIFIVAGVLENTISKNGTLVDVFVHDWYSTSGPNGDHTMRVYDKQNVYFDEISIFVLNDLENQGIPNTRIIFPVENSTVNGTMTIKVEVLVICNCEATTLLMIERTIVGEGTLDSTFLRDGAWFEVYVHQWDTTSVKDGKCQIRVLGKHKQYHDELTVEVKNSDEDEKVEGRLGSREVFLVIVILLIVLAFITVLILVRKRHSQ